MTRFVQPRDFVQCVETWGKQPISRWLLLAAMLAAVFIAPAQAFNPPTDTAGPLAVRIEGPAEVTDAAPPLSIQVVIENSGAEIRRGTLRLGLVDGWQADPAAPVPFEVAAKGESRYDFKVRLAAPIYNALHPIHAFAEFELAGERLAAHPVLIVATRLPNPPRPQLAIAWKPVAVPANAELAVWRLPVRRAVFQVFGEKPRMMPTGWLGAEDKTRATVQLESQSLPDARETIAMHPPWFGGRAGTVFVEFPLSLPKDLPARLRFATAIRRNRADLGEPPSDGVTFRVRVAPLDAPEGEAGKVVYERHTDAKTWQNGEADLSPWAGQTVRLQLESHPGAKNDTTCDSSFWAEPTLVAGTPPALATFPPPADVPSRLLGKLQRDDKQYEVRIWPGRRGLLDAAVGFDYGTKRVLFQGFQVRVLGNALNDRRSPTTLLEVQEELLPQGYRVRHRFQNWVGKFDLVGELRLDQGVLRAKFHLENAPPAIPWRVVYLEDVAAGPWTETAERVYAGPGNVLQKPSTFRLNFDGHRLSTSFVGFDFPGRAAMLQAVDVPPEYLEVDPGARRYTLHTPHAQTLTFIPAQNVWEAVRVWHDVNRLQAAGGVRKLAGRFVFDLWGGKYGPTADALGRAFRYGLTDSVVVWHNWQRWGYDYRLPDIYPPNPEYGSMDEMLRLIRVCNERDVLFAPHDNYIDFYPDADGFSYRHIAFTREGEPVRAWLNEGRKAQSYRFRADAVRPFLERNLHWIRDGLAPTAYFIDVWSSIGPYDYWTSEGRFFDRVSTRDTWAELFAWIRNLLGDNAPQISESGHDQLTGWLDGAQANHLRAGAAPPGSENWTVWGIAAEDAERIPWFDAAHHDRFVLHGAGYESRYLGGLDRQTHGIYSDDYIATEVLTGHPAMVPVPFGREVVRKYWLLHDLMRALALRRIEDVEFVGGNLHRQRVRWCCCMETWVNRGQDDWTLAGRTLPPYGFYARVPMAKGLLEAAIERQEGVAVEWARSPESFYVNARQTAAGRRAAQPLAQTKLIAFGAVTTDGAFRLAPEGEALRLTPLPDGPKFTVHLRVAALPWRLPELTRIESLGEDGRVLKTEPVRRERDAIVVTCEPGVFAYRLAGR
ncbi:MAG: glycoside hydrolase family protein [Pirellulales bacterium]